MKLSFRPQAPAQGCLCQRGLPCQPGSRSLHHILLCHGCDDPKLAQVYHPALPVSRVALCVWHHCPTSASLSFSVLETSYLRVFLPGIAHRRAGPGPLSALASGICPCCHSPTRLVAVHYSPPVHLPHGTTPQAGGDLLGRGPALMELIVPR
jgi:hypothetical protein